MKPFFFYSLLSSLFVPLLFFFLFVAASNVKMNRDMHVVDWMEFNQWQPSVEKTKHYSQAYNMRIGKTDVCSKIIVQRRRKIINFLLSHCQIFSSLSSTCEMWHIQNVKNNEIHFLSLCKLPKYMEIVNTSKYCAEEQKQKKNQKNIQMKKDGESCIHFSNDAFYWNANDICMLWI